MKPVVLVVDDDTAICALLQDVLSEHVFTVSVCHTGQEAILRIEGDPDIALVVLDMMLPDTNGLRWRPIWTPWSTASSRWCRIFWF